MRHASDGQRTPADSADATAQPAMGEDRELGMDPFHRRDDEKHTGAYLLRMVSVLAELDAVSWEQAHRFLVATQRSQYLVCEQLKGMLAEEGETAVHDRKRKLTGEVLTWIKRHMQQVEVVPCGSLSSSEPVGSEIFSPVSGRLRFGVSPASPFSSPRQYGNADERNSYTPSDAARRIASLGASPPESVAFADPQDSDDAKYRTIHDSTRSSNFKVCPYGDLVGRTFSRPFAGSADVLEGEIIDAWYTGFAVPSPSESDKFDVKGRMLFRPARNPPYPDKPRQRHQVLAKVYASSCSPEVYFTSEGDKARKWIYREL